MTDPRSGKPAQPAKSTSPKASQSAPPPPPAPAGRDEPINKQVAAQGQPLAVQMPVAGHKLAEHGRDAAVRPPEGAQVPVPDAAAVASTASEANASEKAGAGAGAPGPAGSLDPQRVDASGQRLTTNQGVPVGDNQHSLKAGLRGPTLLEDFILREKITHFDHERIPERIVHARGSAAHGYFECTADITGLTRAAPFAQVGKRTPVFVRFSTVAGERGSIDTARDVRGFAVKFYTDEGNWDLVGNNIPVFFIQDAMKFPDLVHAVKPEPHHGMPQAASAHDTFWDFVSLMPESTHMLMWAMSDRAIPRSYRMMQGFGVHTYRLVNDAGEARFVKFHWNPVYGTHSLVWDEAVKLGGANPDFHRQDLWEAIEAGHYPAWELQLQVFTEEQAAAFSFDVLDATKLVPEELVPLQTVGRMVLDRNPDNFFAETEQVAFCTAHVVPGIDFSNDPLLAGRIHSYVDTQITRLGGPNFHEIPINRPLAPVHNNQRDGAHRQAIPRGRVAYEPNSLGGGCPFQAGARGFATAPQPVEDSKLRGAPEKFAEHYAQAALFFHSQSDVEKTHIANAFTFELSKVNVPAIRERMVANLRNVSDDLAVAVADGLGLALPDPAPRALANPPAPEVSRSPTLSLAARPGEAGVRSRVVAVLLGEGAEAAGVQAVKDALAAAGAGVKLVGPRVGPLQLADGARVDADGSLANSPSVLFDGVVVAGGAASVAALRRDARTAEFLRDQFRHCKTILALGDGQSLLADAGIDAKGGDPGVQAAADGDAAAAAKRFIAALAKHRHYARETDPPKV